VGEPATRCIEYGTGQPYGNDSLVRCSQSATERVLAGCVHEHVGRYPWCGFHAEVARKGEMFCGRCLDGDGHICELVVAKEPSHA
jgi:hypothetical protein